MSSPTVTMNLSEFQEIQNAKVAADQEAARLRAELVAAKMGGGDATVTRDLTAFARRCLTLARFAVANCPPEMIKGWPVDDLRAVATGLAILPDHSEMDRDLGVDLLHFANDCEAQERRRQMRRASDEPTSAA